MDDKEFAELIIAMVIKNSRGLLGEYALNVDLRVLKEDAEKLYGDQIKKKRA